MKISSLSIVAGLVILSGCASVPAEACDSEADRSAALREAHPYLEHGTNASISVRMAQLYDQEWRDLVAGRYLNWTEGMDEPAIVRDSLAGAHASIHRKWGYATGGDYALAAIREVQAMWREAYQAEDPFTQGAPVRFEGTEYFVVVRHVHLFGEFETPMTFTGRCLERR